MTDTPPNPDVKPARRSLRDRFSLVWLVPIGALAISLGVVWHSYSDRGPLVEIAFPNASGVKAGETELRYRDVVVGLVENVTFSDELADVVVQVRLDKEIAAYVDADSQFWVVRPEVSARGVSGLQTVLSGVFIEGSWNTTIDAPATRFDGLDKPPLVRSGEKGTSIILQSASIKGLSEGTPILYRGIEVGNVANLRLSEDGISVIADGFIRAPEDRLITTATRFWDTSGFKFSFGAQGAQLDVSSLASLVSGGVAFDTIVSGGEAVSQDTGFELFVDEDSARNSVFSSGSTGVTVNMSVVFEGSVSGLTAGAAVEFQGINVGKVTAITGVVDEARFGDRAVRLLATLGLLPAKMGLDSESSEQDVLDFLDDAVQRGLRAQLQNASILTGGLKVAFLVPDSIGPQLPVTIDRNADPYPQIPSVTANLSDFNDTAEGVFNRINELPVEELLGSAISVMDSVNRLLNDDGTTGTPSQVLALIGEIRTLVGSPGVQGIPDQAAGVMESLQASVASLENLMGKIEEAGAVDSLVAALDSASAAADAVSAAMVDVPDLIVSMEQAAISAETLMNTANDLPLADLLARAETLLSSIDALVTAPATQALPGELTATIAEARGAIVDLRQSGVIEQVSTTLDTAKTAIGDVTAALTPVLDSARGAVDTINASVQGVPELVAQLETIATSAQALLTSANALPLEDLVAQTSAVIVSANSILNDPATKALPAQVGAAVDAARDAVEDLRASGVINNADATLDSAQAAVTRITEALMPVLESARTAADSLNAATTDLPRIVERADSIAAQIETLVASAAEIPLEELAARAGALIDSANVLLASSDTQAVPGALNSALAQIEGVLADMRAGGLIDNANATLAATGKAADAIARASDELPALVARMNRLLAEAEAVVGGYRTDGTLGSEAKSTLRDIKAAAKSVSSLARQIERNPNSLLFGR